MIKIEHELLYAPVKVKSRLSYKSPLVAEFADAADQKITLPTLRLLTGTWPDTVVKDPERREELARFLFDWYVTNSQMESLRRKQTTGIRGFVIKSLTFASGVYEGQKQIFWPSAKP